MTGLSVNGTLTTLSHAVIGPLVLSGTMEEEVLGRTFSTQTGTWGTQLIALSLTGPALGNTLSVVLDNANASTGQTSLLADGNAFLIDSFFDLFAELMLDGAPLLSAVTGPLRLTLADSPTSAVSEPSPIVLIGLGLVALGLRHRRSKGSARRHAGFQIILK